MLTNEFIDATIASMKVIGMIPANGKLCVYKGQLSIETEDVVQSVRRWIRNDSREVSLMHIRSTINNAISIITTINESPSGARTVVTGNIAGTSTSLTEWVVGSIISELQRCEGGIKNLKDTYNTDSYMVANLEVVLDRIRAYVREYTTSPDASRVS